MPGTVHPRASLLLQQEHLLGLLPEVRSRLSGIASITHIGVGAKETAGELTGEFAFRVYVKRKCTTDELPSAWCIPPQMYGIATDVIQSSPTTLLADIRKVRPLRGGIQLRNEYVEMGTNTLAGTIGCLAKNIDTLEPLALTCEHVVTHLNTPSGTRVGQPKYVVSCCCCTYNVIGSVLKAVKSATLDCAVVKLDEDIANEIDPLDGINEVEGIGKLVGVAQAVCFETVRKRGRTTELTTGTVVDVLYEGSQILVRPTAAAPAAFADVGDSGSVIVNAANEVIGLLWAADAATRRQGVANHIGPVMRELRILIAGQTDAGLGIPTTGCPPAPP